jgi:hypothetical protein
MKQRVASYGLEVNQPITCFLPLFWNHHIWKFTVGLLANIITGMNDSNGDRRKRI